MLISPPFNKQWVLAWEDACWDSNWKDVGDHLVLEQWNQNEWRTDTCTVLSTNASVIVAGPFSIGEYDTMNHADIFNLSCGAPLTPRQQQQLVGPEYLLWDDAGDDSSSSLIQSLTMTVIGLGESGWSPQSVVTSPLDVNRYTDMRCRMAARNIPSLAKPFQSTGTFCLPG